MQTFRSRESLCIVDLIRTVSLRLSLHRGIRYTLQGTRFQKSLK